MKLKLMFTFLLISMAAAGCGPGNAPPQDDNLAAAQQTLDALNQSVGQESAPPTSQPENPSNPAQEQTPTPRPVENQQPAAVTAAGEPINLFESSDGTLSFPAGTAFHVAHGFSFDGENPPEIVQATSYFILELDGVPLEHDTILVLPGESESTGNVNWLFNFENGLTGTHSLLGRWYQECGRTDDSDSCGDPNAMVEVLTLDLTVNFTP